MYSFSGGFRFKPWFISFQYLIEENRLQVRAVILLFQLTTNLHFTTLVFMSLMMIRLFTLAVVHSVYWTKIFCSVELKIVKPKIVLVVFFEIDILSCAGFGNDVTSSVESWLLIPIVLGVLFSFVYFYGFSTLCAKKSISNRTIQISLLSVSESGRRNGDLKHRIYPGGRTEFRALWAPW